MTVGLKTKITKLEMELVKLKSKAQRQESLIDELSDELLQSKRQINKNNFALTGNGMPTSCKDLSMIGHTLNGLYSVMGVKKQVESVYCDFTKTPSDSSRAKNLKIY